MSIKMIAVIVVIILIVAALAVVFLLPGQAAALSVAATSDKVTATVGETVSFFVNATGGTIANYTWFFGDGQSTDSGNASSITHTYTDPGAYQMVVTGKTSDGKTASNWGAPVAVLVNQVAPDAPDNDSAPAPIASANPILFKSNANVSFNASTSRAYSNETTPDGNVSNYTTTLSANFVDNLTWDFGDGSALVNGTLDEVGAVSHDYTGDGVVYAAFVNVTSIHGTFAKYFVTIVVQPANFQPTTGFVKNPDTIVEESIGEPEMLDPAVDYETAGGEILQNVYETLIWYDGSSAANLKPMIATEVPTTANGGISSDGLNYTFKIKPDVKFHSGNVITTEDVRYSIERVIRINDPNGPAWMLSQVLVKNYSGRWHPQSNVSDFQNAVTVDSTNNSVTFHLQFQYPAFIYVMAYTVASVVEKAVVEAHGGIVDETQNTFMNEGGDAGSGPYKLTAWVINQYIKLDAFNDYWQGAAKIKHVYINKVNDIGTREMHLFSGDADIVYIDRQHKTDVQGKTGLRVSEGAGTFNIDFIGMNQDIQSSSLDIGDIPATFFADIHVRRAFAAAFNNEAFIQNTLFGTAVQPNGPIPSGMFAYNGSVPKFSYNLQTVQDEMKLALDTRTADPADTYFDNGFTLTVFYNAGNKVRQAAVERLAAGLTAALGADKVTITAQALDWGSTYLPALYDGQLTCFLLGWAPDYADPDDYVTPFLLGGNIYAPTIGLDNASLNENITAAAMELNDTARAQLYFNISMSCYENVYYVWADQATQFHVERNWVQGWYFNPMYSGQYFYSLSKG